MRCHKCWRALAFAAETGVADEARGAAVPGQSSPEREAAWSPSAEPSRPAFFTGPGGAPWRLFLVIPVLVIFLLLILLRRTNVPMPDAAPRELSHEEVVEFSQTPVGPVAYGIGAVDPRFDLSEERLRTLVREAVAVWEGAAGRTLFREDAAARLKVNLVFDERQQRRLDENRLKSDIEARDTSRNVLIGDYETERALAGRLDEDYRADAAALSRRVDAYNAAVASWNARGGAPPDELERLRTEQAAITAATDAAERKRRRLNEVLDDVRSLAESINNLGSRNNREIRDYNGRFGEGREFEKGVYDGSSINIYQFDADD